MDSSKAEAQRSMSWVEWTEHRAVSSGTWAAIGKTVRVVDENNSKRQKETKSVHWMLRGRQRQNDQRQP